MASEAIAQMFSVKKDVLLKLMNHEISNVGNPTLLHWAKSIEKNVEKIEILEKLLIEESKYWHNQLRQAF